MKNRKGMSFAIRFAIGNRFGAASKYTLIEFCVHCVDRYGLKEGEVCRIVTLQPGEKTVVPNVMEVTRVK